MCEHMLRKKLTSVPPPNPPQDAMMKSMEKEESLAIVVCAELAMGCFLELMSSMQEPGPSREQTPYEQLVRRAPEGGFLLPARIQAKTENSIDELEQMLGAEAEYMVQNALDRFSSALHALIETNRLRLRAEQIVQDKFQVLVGRVGDGD